MTLSFEMTVKGKAKVKVKVKAKAKVKEKEKEKVRTKEKGRARAGKVRQTLQEQSSRHHRLHLRRRLKAPRLWLEARRRRA